MTFDEYITARNEMVDCKDYRYNIYRHVAFRLWQRYDFAHASFRMTDWERISYACATRQYPIYYKTNAASYFKVTLDGKEVMWLYSREQRCVMTVVPIFEIDHFRVQYEKEYLNVRKILPRR